MSFANNIKTIRKDHNLSQEQLAEKLGVSRQSVSKWESGQSYPEMDKILLICKLFECDIDALMNDNIKEVNETKQQKTKVNKAIEDFFDAITRLVDLFVAMTFKQKVKCLFEQVVNAGVLALLGVIVWAILESVLGGIFRVLDSSWYYGILSVFGSLYTIVAVVLAIIVMLHIFKIRYLDYYEIIKPETEKEDNLTEKPEEQDPSKSQDTPENEPQRKALFSKRGEKIIIRDPNHSSSKFLVSIMKAVVIIFKLFLGFAGLCVAFGFVFITMLLVAAFLFVKTGLLFIGGFLVLAAMLGIHFVVLRLIYNFLTARKSNKRITAVILIVSLAFSGIGAGLFLIGTTQFNMVQTPITTESEFTLPMEEALTIESGYAPIKYIETDSEDVSLRVIHSQYCKIHLENHDHRVWVDASENKNAFEKLRKIIEDMNGKQINSCMFQNPVEEITVCTSKANIEKIKANEEYRQSTEEHIQNLYNKIEKLERENTLLQNRLEEKNRLIEEKESELETEMPQQP